MVWADEVIHMSSLARLSRPAGQQCAHSLMSLLDVLIRPLPYVFINTLYQNFQLSADVL
jgi:hypothetical protein